MACAVCRSQPEEVGLLCENCRDDVGASIGLLPEQLLATIAKPTGDVLIDQWGRAHALESRTMIGRALDGTGIMILEAWVSRHHAHLAQETDGWRLRDLGSSNGTYVNDVPVGDSTLLRHGDRISIGSIGFYLVCGLGQVPKVEVDPAVITTIRSVQRLSLTFPEPEHRTVETQVTGVPVFVEREDTDVGLPTIPMRLAEPTGGGGGVLEIGRVSVQLSANQAELIGLLARRMLEEAHQPAQVRGFVRTSELLGSLSWDTHEPDDNHVKQLIRRARRLLMRAGLGDLIESRHRFGYRLRLIPAS
jgi:pSer/pThr/pTyr-binding forkhead associated (FHA) protein